MPHLLIMTPNRIFVDKEIEEAILATNTGRIGILENHSPLVTSLEISTLRFKERGESWISLALLGGFALIQDDFLTVLVNEAVLGSVLDAEECTKEVESARTYFEQCTDKKEKIEFKLQYMRTIAKLEAAKLMASAV
jgi:F-type H+-transporting ATPase subunit epsilon